MFFMYRCSSYFLLTFCTLCKTSPNVSAYLNKKYSDLYSNNTPIILELQSVVSAPISHGEGQWFESCQKCPSHTLQEKVPSSI